MLPKFWPKISPKKTWAGTVAGWIGAAIIGAIFVWKGHSSGELIAISDKQEISDHEVKEIQRLIKQIQNVFYEFAIDKK